MDFIKEIVKGIAIGAGAILPGISSGVLCVIFGIYEKLINSILYFFKDIKNNFKFLFPILIGIFIGIILFGNILKILFNNYPSQAKFCFIGLILGGIPSLLKTANTKKHFQLHYLLYTITTFLLTVFLLILEKNFSSCNAIPSKNFLFLVFAGFIMSIGVVVPGVSSSALLMLLNMYEIYLLAISIVDMCILIPIGIGLIIGGFLFLFLINFCIDKFYIQTYYSIIGFVLGSIIILYPGITLDIDGLFSIFIFFLSFSIISIIEKKETH